MGRKRTFVFNKRTQRVEPLGSRAPEVAVVDAPFIHDDTIPDTESHATDERKIFTSRSKLFEHYRENGYECTGGSHLNGKMFTANSGKVFDPEAERVRKAQWGMLKVDPAIRHEVMEARRQCEWGMAPINEREKEQCQREEREYQKYKKTMA